MAANNSLPELGDPAEFLLATTKYHDCFLTVGNPAVEQVERIGVSSTHLIAHSTVFRDMLADSQLADPTGSNTHIADISPATFKLMLRHVYGCKLPKMTPEEATDLALCADKYNIQRLVGKAVKLIMSTSAENVFPAILCVTYINCPDLGIQVSKIIQQQTDRIIQNPNFLQLDENCLLFVVKQNMMNISELELWKSLVCWGENQVKMFPEKTLRNCLIKVLHHVRLLTLTSSEIVDHVLPTKILTPDEFMDLTLAVSKTQTLLQSPNLCNVLQKRSIYRDDRKNKDKIFTRFNNTYYCDSKPITINLHSFIDFRALESKPCSTLTIKPLVNIEISSFKLAE